MATARARLFVTDYLAPGIWLPAILITVVNVVLFLALFSGIAGR